jgi:hypothetical protein
VSGDDALQIQNKIKRSTDHKHISLHLEWVGFFLLVGWSFSSNAPVGVITSLAFLLA